MSDVDGNGGERRGRALKPGRHPAPPIPDPRVQSAFRAATRFCLRHYFDTEYHGRGHVPTDGPAVVVSNHPSYIDPFFVGLGVRRWITWLAWEDAFDWGVVGTILRTLGAIPVDVERPRPSTFKASFEVLAQERLLGVFFEGGRSTTGHGVDEPRRGAGLIALQAKVPVVPVTLAGVRRLWPVGGAPRPGKVVVRYHPPVQPAEIEGRSLRAREADLLARVRHRIAGALPPDGRHR